MQLIQQHPWLLCPGGDGVPAYLQQRTGNMLLAEGPVGPRQEAEHGGCPLPGPPAALLCPALLQAWQGKQLRPLAHGCSICCHGNNGMSHLQSPVMGLLGFVGSLVRHITPSHAGRGMVCVNHSIRHEVGDTGVTQFKADGILHQKHIVCCSLVRQETKTHSSPHKSKAQPSGFLLQTGAEKQHVWHHQPHRWHQPPRLCRDDPLPAPSL